MTLNVQLLTISSMIAGGIFLGIALHTFRHFSFIIDRHVIVQYSLEVVFWVSQSVLLFYLLYLVNYGDLRVYVILAVFLGYSMYVAFLKTAYDRVLRLILSILKWIFNVIVTLLSILILKPVNFILGSIKVILLTIIRLILSILGFLLTPVKKLYRKLPKRYFNFFRKVRSIYSTIKDKLKRN